MHITDNTNFTDNFHFIDNINFTENFHFTDNTNFSFCKKFKILKITNIKCKCTILKPQDKMLNIPLRPGAIITRELIRNLMAMILCPIKSTDNNKKPIPTILAPYSITSRYSTLAKEYPYSCKTSIGVKA